MWSNFRFGANLLQCSKCFTQSERSTYILRRLMPTRLSKLGAEFPKKLKRKNFYYEVVANTDLTKKPPLNVVLTQEVPGIGLKDTPEAQSIMETKEEKQYSSVNSKFVENYLSTQGVPIILNAETKWKLEQWHVKLALRKIDILTKDECITIPKEITGPNLDIENKDFLVELVMNKMDKFLLRCRIYHWSTANPHLNKKNMDVQSPSEALFPDEKEKIDAIVKYELDVKRKRMLSGSAGRIKMKNLI